MNKKFNPDNYPWKSNINYRLHKNLYKVGKGEQGVLLCQPYKSEILLYWKFRTPQLAKISAEKIYSLFLEYLEQDDFPGADMARKFLQMGFTRARRYANYKGGKKYGKDRNHLLPKGTGEPLKAQSARIFYKAWQQAEKNKKYSLMKEEWKKIMG
ncbi:MAG: hypothetical protein K0S27_1436 [Gammaproteobacteria bacterium]|jgi:hypothetical protein|nr:hypothetical protein [Gammaproteobacteria bacterium]